MTSFTLSIEQVRSAPPEVRRWIEREITTAVAALNRSQHDPSQVHEAALAACMPQEASQLFEMIKGNFLLSQVFFELARDMPNSHGAAPLHPLSVADILRHTRLGDGDRLVDCFTAINQAFRRSATIRKRRYLALINVDMCSFTKRHTRAFVSSGSSCSLSMRQWLADRRWPASHRLTSSQARTSLNTGRVPPASTSERDFK